MPWGQVIDWGIKLLLALGGVGGITALLMWPRQRNKLIADTGKTGAEADLLTADAATKRTSREQAILDMYDRMAKAMETRLLDAEAKIDSLTGYVEVLVQALRGAGAAVPPMPRRMAEEAQHGTAAREAEVPR